MGRTVVAILVIVFGAGSILFWGTTAEASKAGASKAGRAQSIFESTCNACHDQFGRPTEAGKAIGAPDLGSPEVQKLTDAQIKEQIMYGKTNMPGFKDSLKPEEIAELARYIRVFGKKK
jgi:mono/diheme cytochrome c family protein